MSANAAGAPVAPAAVARLPRQVKLFGAVSLLNDFASEMIYPLLPALVTGVLGAGPQALGALDGAADFAAAFVKLGAGRLADRPARRGRLVVLGYAVAVLRSEEHTSELQSLAYLVCRLLLEKKKKTGQTSCGPARLAITRLSAPPA